MSLRNTRHPGMDGVNKQENSLNERLTGQREEMVHVGDGRPCQYFIFCSELNDKMPENFEQRNNLL